MEEPYLAWFAHSWATEEFIKILLKNRRNYLASLACKNGTSNQGNGGRKENGEEDKDEEDGDKEEEEKEDGDKEEEEDSDEGKDEGVHETRDGVGDGSEDEGGHGDGYKLEHGGEYEDETKDKNGEEDEDGEGMKAVATSCTICAKAICQCNKAGSDSNDVSAGTHMHNVSRKKVKNTIDEGSWGSGHDADVE